MSSKSSDKVSDKVPVLEILLFGGLIMMLLTSLLRWNLASKDSTPATTQTIANQGANQLAVNSSPVVPPPAQPTATVAPAPIVGTHRVLCSEGDVGLNFRPQAGFSQPLFVVPCGAIVTVTGSPINVQNETWSPVTYANRNGWSATKLLQPIR